MDRFEHAVQSVPQASVDTTILVYVQQYLDELVHSLGGPAAVVKEALRLYDTYGATYDIPGIPDFIEATVVDPLVRKAIEYTILTAHDAIHPGV